MSTVSPNHRRYDVAIVGAAVAGCIAALRYAEAGLSVALIEKKRGLEDYKILCTHFIQPIAFPVLARLELDRLIEAAGGLRTKAAFWTERGWIDPAGESYAAGETLVAYNVERRLLDLLLRRRVAKLSNVDWYLGQRVLALERMGDHARLQLEDGAGPRAIEARLIIAADGRNSTLARVVENKTRGADNHRAAFFAYFKGVAATPGNRSLFMLYEDEMAFLYPLCEGRTLLSIYPRKERSREWHGHQDKARLLVRFMQRFPCCPPLDEAIALTPVYGYADYPNLSRDPVHEGVAFIGDAALSLDPMSGVGCGFAIVAADELVEHTHRALREGGELAGGLQAYSQAFSQMLEPHAEGIKADSLIGKSRESVLKVYNHITSDPQLGEAFIALTGRLVLPRHFQKLYLRSLGLKAGPEVAVGERRISAVEPNHANSA